MKWPITVLAKPDPRGNRLSSSDFAATPVGAAVLGTFFLAIVRFGTRVHPWWFLLGIATYWMFGQELARRRDLRSVWLKNGELRISDPDGDLFVPVTEVAGVSEKWAVMFRGRVATIHWRDPERRSVCFLVRSGFRGEPQRLIALAQQGLSAPSVSDV